MTDFERCLLIVAAIVGMLALYLFAIGTGVVR